MPLVLAKKLANRTYDDSVIIFDERSGQTHCLDIAVLTLFELIEKHSPTNEDALIELVASDFNEEEKLQTIDYISNMIKNLVELQLVDMT